MQSQSSDTFPSHNGNGPISYYDPAIYYTRPFSIDSESNPTSKEENNNSEILIPSPPPPLSFFHFPSPTFEDTQIFLEQHHDFLLQFHHQPLTQDSEPQPHHQPVNVINMEEEGSVKKGVQVPRKQSGKRDRHSKINTARGLRDRRMRLSLDVAKRFFGLQDMLGFDKASKTVEWLLNQAKVEVNRLVKEKKKLKKHDDNNHHHHHHDQCCSSASSECEEGVSSLDEVVVSGDQEQQLERVDKAVKRRVKHCRKISAFNPLAKECRERARERARERTREKMRNRESKQCREETINHQDLIQLGSWNPFETEELSGAKTPTVHPSLDVITEAKEETYHPKDHDDDSFIIFNKWSPSLFFNHSGFYQEVSFNFHQML
ncbi:hypothetical protein VNO78_02686 [Psophocarpus tetragonolobus]|uniref:Uncharacterized protein n=1 Tax=Psophocarpus tetragonolobus TaxID=3891 RepID=A0AAN9T2W0_PSOTE